MSQVSAGGRFRRAASCRLSQINRSSFYKELRDRFTSLDDYSLWEPSPPDNSAITWISPPSLISLFNWTDPLSHCSPPLDFGSPQTQLTPSPVYSPKPLDFSTTTQPRSCALHHRHIWRCTFSYSKIKHFIFS
uniref:Uncharacterized protein n=1 Tax=Nothobranchius korthausae TaxID=1143690 RepID=A0A1A8ETE9_9TELE